MYSGHGYATVVQAVKISIMIVRSHIVHCFSSCEIKENAEMNVQRSLIQELMLYELKMSQSIVDSKTNPPINTRRISGKLGISQFCVVGHLYGLDKSILSCRIVPQVSKILSNILLALLFFQITNKKFCFSTLLWRKSL